MADTYPRISAPTFLREGPENSPSAVGLHKPALQAIAQPPAPTAQTANTLRVFFTQVGRRPLCSGMIGNVAAPATPEVRRF